MSENSETRLQPLAEQREPEPAVEVPAKDSAVSRRKALISALLAGGSSGRDRPRRRPPANACLLRTVTLSALTAVRRAVTERRRANVLKFRPICRREPLRGWTAEMQSILKKRTVTRFVVTATVREAKSWSSTAATLTISIRVILRDHCPLSGLSCFTEVAYLRIRRQGLITATTSR